MPTGWWLVSYAALWALIVLEFFVLIAVVRYVSELLRHWVRHDPDQGLPLGVVAPALPDRDAFGDVVPRFGAAGRPTLLLFLSRGCSGCREAMKMMPELSELPGLSVVLIVSAKPAECRFFAETHRRSELFPGVAVVPDWDRRLTDDYMVPLVPYGVVVDATGRITAKGSAGLMPHVEGLLRQAAEMERALALKQASGAGGWTAEAVPNIAASGGGRQG